MEIWKDVKGYEGIYQVSDQGRVKSLKYGEKRILKSCPNGIGYHIVGLFLDKNVKSHYVHRLVATAFINNPDNKREVDHVNRDKNDNRACNLRWVTRQENMENRSYENYNNYMSDEGRENIRKAKSKAVRCVETGKVYRSTIEASKEMGIHVSQIRACARKQKHYNTAGGYHWEYLEDNK